MPVHDDAASRGKPPRTIRYGLGAVKGTGQGAVEEILRARADGPFADLFDFCRRIDRHTVNRRTIEALIKAGAFDTLEPNRAALLATLATALEAAEQAERSASQVSLFGDGDLAASVQGELQQVAPWDLRERLSQEKTALGFFFSGHMFDAWRDEVRRIVPTPLNKIQPQRDPQWMAGVLLEVRTQMTRRGKMVFAVLDDGTAQFEISVFNELFEANRALLREDRLLIVHGKVSNDEYSGGVRIVAETLYDLERARAARARVLRILLNGNADAARLRQVLDPFRAVPGPADDGPCGTPVEVTYQSQTASCTVRLGNDWRVRVPDDLLQQLQAWAGAPSVQLDY